MSKFQEFMEEHLPQGERQEQLRQAIEKFASLGDPISSAEFDDRLCQFADLFEAVEPEVDQDELKAVILLMIEEGIDQINSGSLIAALAFSRMPSEH